MSRKNILHHFEKIDTEEKAYWLGFLYADGYVFASEDRIELGLAEKDLHHIEKFKDFIGLKNRICYRPKTKSYRFSFRSQNLKQDLMNKGCIPKKSLSLLFPTEEQVPRYLIRHFIRGYFDGDGWFTNTEKSFQVGIIGTEDFIKGFINNIPIQAKNNQSQECKRFMFSALQDVTNFLDYIYHHSVVYLDRKYEHYLGFKQNGKIMINSLPPLNSGIKREG